MKKGPVAIVALIIALISVFPLCLHAANSYPGGYTGWRMDMPKHAAERGIKIKAKPGAIIAEQELASFLSMTIKARITYSSFSQSSVHISVTYLQEYASRLVDIVEIKQLDQAVIGSVDPRYAGSEGSAIIIKLISVDPKDWTATFEVRTQ